MIRGSAVPTTVRFSEVRNRTVRIPPNASSWSRRRSSTTAGRLLALVRRRRGRTREQVHELAQRPVGLADPVGAHVPVRALQGLRHRESRLPADLATALGHAEHRLAAVVGVASAGQQAHLEETVEHPARARGGQGRELSDPHRARLAPLDESQAEELPGRDPVALLQGRLDHPLERARQQADVLGELQVGVVAGWFHAGHSRVGVYDRAPGSARVSSPATSGAGPAEGQASGDRPTPRRTPGPAGRLLRRLRLAPVPPPTNRMPAPVTKPKSYQWPLLWTS